MGRNRKNKEPLTAYDIAKKRVEEKKKFYRHLSTYVVMSIFFYMINYLSNPGHWWFYWPMLGWGVGLAFHYVNIFGIPGLVEEMSPEWEEKQIQAELRRLEKKGMDISRPAPKEEAPLELKELEKRKRESWDDNELVIHFLVYICFTF